MNAAVLIRMSIAILRRHAVRSLLTLLGVMIGIAAIIVTFSIGNGAQVRVREQIMAMGENAIYIIPGNIIERGTVRSGSADAIRLKERDLTAIVRQCPEIISATRGLDALLVVERGTKSVRERVYGTDANMLEINKNTILYGSYFRQAHLDTHAQVAVLGFDVAKKLFGKTNPIGETVTIGGFPFTVVGVIDYVDYFWGIQDPNARVYIPFTVARNYFAKPEATSDDLGFMGLSVGSEENPGAALRKVRRILRFMHNTDDDEADDFTVFDQQSIARSAGVASRVIKLFGLIAASISLLVGGIGVMNIMLVSVKERTREIGVRLAVGATQAAIRNQFLVESAVLSCVGGVIGVVVGIVLQHILSQATNLPGRVEYGAILLSLIATILTGIFFGFYPAHLGSKLNPVDALRRK